MSHNQPEFAVRCEWGAQGMVQLAPRSDACRHHRRRTLLDDLRRHRGRLWRSGLPLWISQRLGVRLR